MWSKSTHMSTFRHSGLWTCSAAADGAGATVGASTPATRILSILFLLWRRLWMSLPSLSMDTYLEFSTVWMRLYAAWPSLCLEKITIMTWFVVGWRIFLCLSPKVVNRDFLVFSTPSPAPLPYWVSGSPEASRLCTSSPWYSQYFKRLVTLNTFQEDFVLLGDVPKLPKKRRSSWHDVSSRSQLCFREWYKSTVARSEAEKAGSLICSSASWTSSLVEMDDMSNVTVHFSPSWWQPENETRKWDFRLTHCSLGWIWTNQICGQMSKHWSERVNRTGCVLDPLCKDVWGLIYNLPT